ncbi:MAG: signal peptidase II [Chloroflexota bacterium]
MNQTNPIAPAGNPAPAAPPASMGWQSILFIVAGLVITIDHLTKLLVEAWLPLNTTWAPFPALGDYFRLTHTSNTGAAFGLFPGGSPVFAAVAVGVALFILVYNYRLEAGHTLLRVALGLQLGGAMGNLIDRLRLGHVTDFFDFGPWPVFNVADLAVVTGVVLLGFLMFREQREEQKERNERPGAPN